MSGADRHDRLRGRLVHTYMPYTYINMVAKFHVCICTVCKVYMHTVYIHIWCVYVCMHIYKVLTDMIIFVTISDNTDPHTREGLPHASRQLLLRDQQVVHS